MLGGCTLGLAAAEAGSSDGDLINMCDGFFCMEHYSGSMSFCLFVCSTLHFRQDLLGSDAVMVTDPLMQAISLADPISGWPANQQQNIALLAELGTSSPLQIELNGNSTHSGLWLPVNAEAKCQPEHYDHLWPNRSSCHMDRDKW